MDVTGEREVVLRHEVEGTGVDDGEDLGGQLIDAFGFQVGIERQRRVGELSDSLLDAELEGVLGRLAINQGLLPLEPLHGVVEFELELFQPLEGGELVVRQRAEGAVLEDGAGDLVLSLFQRLGELGRDLVVVAVAGRQALQSGRLDALLEVR